MREFQRSYFLEMLTRHGNCVAKVAREAELNRSELYRKLAGLGLWPHDRGTGRPPIYNGSAWVCH